MSKLEAWHTDSNRPRVFLNMEAFYVRKTSSFPEGRNKQQSSIRSERNQLRFKEIKVFVSI